MNLISIRIYILASVKHGEDNASAIGQSIARLRNDIKIGIGDVPGALFHLVQEGYLETEASGTRQNGKIYKLTTKGFELLDQQASHLQKLLKYISEGIIDDISS